MDQTEPLFWRIMTTKAINDKNSRRLSLERRDGGQTSEDHNEQQQQQPANSSSENA